ncbi:MAG: N-6 DNA methylase, partial [Vicingaceae bacterium]
LKHIDDPLIVNRIIVTAFASYNGIANVSNEIIGKLILSTDHPVFIELIGLIPKFDFDEVIEAFEVAIPNKESQTNGAVYTPSRIKDYIVAKALQETDTSICNLLAADISCGCGAFLYTLAKSLKSSCKTTYFEIFQNQLFGLDISQNSIDRAKILLTLLAISEGEDIHEFNFNLFVANALDFNWNSIPTVSTNQGFDLIVGNPPYVRAKNLDKGSKDLLKNWQVTKTGNPDLYIPFFEIGISNLNNTGVLGYITVNSFFKSVNARSLRKYFSFESLTLSIINFGHEQVFENKLTYNNPKALSNIMKIEKAGTPLGDLLTIKNGIATLSNSTYIFKPIDEIDDFYTFEKDGKIHKVEKRICRDIIKPNILKKEHEIPELQEKIIYPYSNGKAPLSLMKEEFFATEFPLAHKYLGLYKKELNKRDKGKGDYGEWFAFGRTQALTDKGLKLLFPYISKHPH